MSKCKKEKFYINDCENCKGESKKMWKVINKVTGKTAKPNTYPNYIEVKNTDGDLIKIRDKFEIANAMNRQFTEMGNKLVVSSSQHRLTSPTT